MNKTAVDFPLENRCFSRQKTVTQLAAATSCGTLYDTLYHNHESITTLTLITLLVIKLFLLLLKMITFKKYYEKPTHNFTYNLYF